MARKNIKIRLDVDSINKAISELKKYDYGMEAKVDKFLHKLMEVGIKTAKMNTGVIDDLGNVEYLITFMSEIEATSDGCTAILIGKDATKIQREWLGMEKDANGQPTGVLFLKTAEVSPLLMAEFGSGNEAQGEIEKVGYNIPSWGKSPQGTFPGQTHASDKGGWSWRDIQGNWHHSTGIEPTQPMYKAYSEMRRSIKKIAREVFREV